MKHIEPYLGLLPLGKIRKEHVSAFFDTRCSDRLRVSALGRIDLSEHDIELLRSYRKHQMAARASEWQFTDFLSVCGTLAKNHDGKLSLQRPKGKRDRRIDLNPFTVELLRKHRKRQYPLSPWVFSDTNGNPMQKDNFGHRIFRPLLRKAGIKRIRFHDLRHSSATLYLAAGENIKVVQERLGHASAKMTLDVYAKAVPTLQREGAERMDSILSPDGDTSTNYKMG